MIRLGTIVGALMVGTVALAQPPAPRPTAPASAESESATAERPQQRSARPRSFVTEHHGRFNGVSVDYTGTVGETILPGANGQPSASLVSIAYVRNDLKDATTRPVIFIFNGGPGSSSMWLHMAGLGPRRAAVPNDGGLPGAPPYSLVDNEATLLDVADLVFIDPIGTGFSRLLPGGKPEDFYGTIEDGRSMCDFLRIWLTKNKRWNSPKYVVGESYGTIRAAEMGKQLPGYGIFLNGIVLLGQAMDFTHTTPIAGLDTSYPIYLPTMAAAAWYYGKVNKQSRTLETFIEEARQYAQTEYATALFAGSRLPQPQRDKVAARLAELSGVPAKTFLENDLRLTANRYCLELLKDQGKAVSRYDIRYAVPLARGPNEELLPDPIGSNVGAELATLLNHYLHSELAVDIDDRYETLARLRWNNNEPVPGQRLGVYENVAPLLGTAMRQNPDLRLFVGEGYYDMLTPLFSAEFTVTHNGMPLDRVTFGYYQAGHMPYLGDSNLKKLTSDLRAFVSAKSR